MTTRFEQQDIDRLMAENKDLARANGRVSGLDPLFSVSEAKSKKVTTEAKLETPGASSLIESEANFMSWVIDLARLRGYKVAHFRGGWSKDGKRYNTPVQGDSGLPDVVLAKVGRVIFAELKSDTGKLSPEQVEWGRILSLGPAECYLWRPSMRSEIEKVLL